MPCTDTEWQKWQWSNGLWGFLSCPFIKSLSKNSWVYLEILKYFPVLFQEENLQRKCHAYSENIAGEGYLYFVLILKTLDASQPTLTFLEAANTWYISREIQCKFLIASCLAICFRNTWASPLYAAIVGHSAPKFCLESWYEIRYSRNN